MPNGMYGGVRGKGTKTGQKTFVPRPTRLLVVGVFSAVFKVFVFPDIAFSRT